MRGGVLAPWRATGIHNRPAWLLRPLAWACVAAALAGGTAGAQHRAAAAKSAQHHPATTASHSSSRHTRSSASHGSPAARSGARTLPPHGKAAARSRFGGTASSSHRSSASSNASDAAHGRIPRKGSVGTSGVYRGSGVELAPATTAHDEPAADTEAARPSFTAVPQILAQGASALQYPAALRGFFQQLRQREDEPGNGTVRVMQWGDSHTAADMFSGQLRARMQARFGDGGVGFTYAGHPFAGYRILGSSRNQSGGWHTLGTHFTDLGDRLLGLGGVAIESQRSGDVASLDAPCLTFDLQYLRQPGGGALQVSEDGQVVANLNTADNAAPAADAGTADSALADQSSQQVDAAVENPSAVADLAAQDTAAPTGTGSARAGSGGNFRYNCQAGSHHFTFTTEGGGPVRLLGTVSLQPGITWEAMGINGAEAPLILRWNQPLFQGYLAAAHPALIVLAYGTNEAAARWQGEVYRQTFTRLIQMLHTTSPASSILVLGPGDRAIGSTYYTTGYTTSGRGRRARRVAHHVAHRVYTPYRGTDRILNAQRDVCSTTGLCAFWDWRARQGGFGIVNRWVAAGYAQPDHTHLTGTGYRALADALTADLLSAYSAFGAGQNGSPSVP